MVAATLLIISCVSLVTLVVGIAIQYQCSSNQERHLRDIVRLHRQNAMRNLMEGISDDDGENNDDNQPGYVNPEAEGTPCGSSELPNYPIR